MVADPVEIPGKRRRQQQNDQRDMQHKYRSGHTSGCRALKLAGDLGYEQMQDEQRMDLRGNMIDKRADLHGTLRFGRGQSGQQHRQDVADIIEQYDQVENDDIIGLPHRVLFHVAAQPVMPDALHHNHYQEQNKHLIPDLDNDQYESPLADAFTHAVHRCTAFPV